MEPDAERTLRRARRAVRVLRLVFYAGAALVAFLLLTAGSDAHRPLVGQTRQGHEFAIAVDGKRPIWFETSIRARCPDGYEFTRHWASTGKLHLDGDVLDVRETAPRRWSNGRLGRQTLHVRARVDDEAVTGTLWMVERLGAYTCASGPVIFSARAG